MKTNLTLVFAISVTTLLFAVASHLNAQGNDKNIAFIPAKNHPPFVAFLNQYGYADYNAAVTTYDTAASAADKAAKASLKTSKANSKALKSFTATYKKDAAGAIWSIGQDAMIASFSKDNVKTNVVYNKKGRWLHTLTYYPENKTPQDIASTIDYDYPKDEIRLTVKVEEGSLLFYIVQLEGKTTLKKVTVYNGEVNTIDELTKSK